ncbi:carbon-nitrogen hydrolase family protein [Pseudomonas fulva]|nr:carbon-nitrogen hydrolase family protein [Pseudomonas fulva]MBF8780410.1 carbon-nitrogen hydrolase family protein [Pseudomonas fulva]
MKICAVQMASLKGDVQGNLERHLWWLEQAKARGAELVSFPELSLTGYYPSLARQLSAPAGTSLLDPLQAACDAAGIAVAVGLPVSSLQGVKIGMAILRAGQPRLAYAKRRLHEDEMHWFVPGDQQLVFQAGPQQIAPAICHESMFLNHAQQARALGATLYLVSVAKTTKGVTQGFEHYPEVARRLEMPVVLANCVGAAEDFTGAGHSAAWDGRGQLLAQLDGESEGLVLMDLATGHAEALSLRGPWNRDQRAPR